jgi:hypothetical protein
MKKSIADHADAFAYYWRALASDMPEPKREHRFDDNRQWRFDFAWPRKYGPGGVAVEIDGGNRMVRNGVAVGRHTQVADYAKRNAAAVQGWSMLAFTPDMLRDDPADCVAQVILCLRARGITN